MSSLMERNSRIMDRIGQYSGRIADRSFAKKEGTKSRIAQMVQDFMARKDADTQREHETSERLGGEAFLAEQSSLARGHDKTMAATEFSNLMAQAAAEHGFRLAELSLSDQMALKRIEQEYANSLRLLEEQYKEGGLQDEYDKRKAALDFQTKKDIYDKIDAPEARIRAQEEYDRTKLLAGDRGADKGDENDPTSQAYIEAMFITQWAANRSGMLDEMNKLLPVYTEEQLAPFRDYMMTVIQETSTSPESMLRAQQSLNAWIASMIGEPVETTETVDDETFPYKRIPGVIDTNKPRPILAKTLGGEVAGAKATATKILKESIPGEYQEAYQGVSFDEMDLFQRIKDLLPQASSSAASEVLQGHMDTIQSKALGAYQISELAKKIDEYVAKNTSAETPSAETPATDTPDLAARGADIKSKANERLVTQLNGYLEGADASLTRRIQNALAKLEAGDPTEANLLLNLLRKTR